MQSDPNTDPKPESPSADAAPSPFTLYHEGRFAEAWDAATLAMRIHPRPGLWNIAGLSAQALGRPEEALAFLEEYRRLKPAEPGGHYNLAILKAEMGRADEAERRYREALALQPDHAGALRNLANLCSAQSRHGEAEALYRDLLRADGDHVEALVNLGFLYQRSQRFPEAEHCYEQVLRLEPAHSSAQFNLGVLLLTQGRYDPGWRFYDQRADPAKSGGVKPPDLPFPRWRGESLEGKSLLIWPEQGFGDEIQFCRYVPLLKAQGARRIDVVCKPALRPLLETLEGVDEVIPQGQSTTFAVPDYWTLALSIPGHLHTRIDTIPTNLPYLQADPGRIAEWKPRLPVGSPRVGLVWKGSSAHGNDAHRSLPNLESLAPLWTVPGIHFVSLQKGQGEDEPAQWRDRLPLTELGSQIRDFADTAALVAQLDLIICVDTAIAHLAGALGKPCWVLLSDFDTDWRWLRERTDSPWYPGVMRLFRQYRVDDWETPIRWMTECFAEWRAA